MPRVRASVWNQTYKSFLRLADPFVTWGENATFASGCSTRAHYEGSVWLGKDTGIKEGARIVAQAGRAIIGRNSFIGVGTIIVGFSHIAIGSDALIAGYVTIRDQDHEFETAEPARQAGTRIAPIRIGANVWIGAKATITRGVTVGHNAVVTHDVPARILNYRQVGT